MLKQWFQEHISWPYPDVVQQVLFSFCFWNVLTVCPACAHGCVSPCLWRKPTQKKLAEMTGLSVKKVNTWFVNARKRRRSEPPASSDVLKLV